MKPFTIFIHVLGVVLLTACGGGGSDNASNDEADNNNSNSSATSLAAGYRLAKWQSGVTVNFIDDCTMTFTSTGVPSHGMTTYYLVPSNVVVATTPNGNLNLGVATVTPSTEISTYTLNICPEDLASVAQTGGGAIGWMISGAALFNAFEADNTTVANADNVSYTFVDNNGVTQTAQFIDDCGGHNTPVVAGNQYHYHGYSSCVSIAAGDTETGPSHLVGVANDGYPIYNDRDINGNLVDVSQLDACNGITSATPEFPNGVYHYVLPSGDARNTAQAAPRCLKGKVPAQLKIDVALKTGFCTTRPLSDPSILTKLNVNGSF